MSQKTFLQLVAMAYQESGLTGTPPVSVENQIGRKADMVRWVQQAHEEIQGAAPDWTFDWAQGSFQLTTAADIYDPVADFGIVGGIRALPRKGGYSYPSIQTPNSRQNLGYAEWEIFREMTPPVANGQPTLFTLRPDGRVQYWPYPDRDITATHEYQLNPQVLALDADVPRFPARFVEAIAWKAVIIGCGKTKDWSRRDSAEENYYRKFELMQMECRPQVVTGGPLA
jgi:hypothetical protein